MAFQRINKHPKNQKNIKLFGYYAVKYINDNGNATYKMRNPTNIQYEYFNDGDQQKFKMTKSKTKNGDTLLFLEGNIEYLNEFMNKRIVMFETKISTVEWKEQQIKQLIEFTNKKHDNNKSYYSVLTHQKYMTDLEVYINYNYEIEEMNIIVTVPAWKAVSKTDTLIDDVVNIIQINILEKTTPLYKDIINIFMTFNKNLNNEYYNSKNECSNINNTNEKNINNTNEKNIKYLIKNINIKDSNNNDNNNVNVGINNE